MTTIYCLRFGTPPTWRARSPYLYPPGSPVIPPGTGFPFRCLLLFTGLRWRYLNLPPRCSLAVTILLITYLHGPHRKHHSSVDRVLILPSCCPETGCATPFNKNPLPQQRAWFRDRYTATGLLHATVSFLVTSNPSSSQFSVLIREFTRIRIWISYRIWRKETT
jgi:hypothetical protein